MDYLLIIIADVLLALDFALQKRHQINKGTDLVSGLQFNMLGGLATAVIFFAVSGFTLEFSLFSLACAAGMAICIIVYTLLGFKILREGNISTYSIFLMSGGMILPYIFGIVALNERVTPLRVIGIMGILAATFLSSQTKIKLTIKLCLLCMAVFVLNGCVSILSKVHQTNTYFPHVDSVALVVYSGLLKSVISGITLLRIRSRSGQKNFDNTVFSDTRAVLLVLLSAAISGGSYLLQLIGAKTVPASVLYPLITGGCIVLSAIVGKLLFRETLGKPGRISIILCFLSILLFA